MAGSSSRSDAGLEAALRGISLEMSAFDRFVAGDMTKTAVKIAQRRRKGKVDLVLPISPSTIETADLLLAKLGLPGRGQLVDLAIYALNKAVVVQERRVRLRKAKELRDGQS